MTIFSVRGEDFGRLLEVNQALCDSLGYSREELLEMDFQSLGHPDDVERDIAYVRHMIAQRAGPRQVEKRYVRSDGSIVWGLLSTSLLHGPDGEIAYGLGQVQDTTERHRAEDELAVRAAQQAAVVELGRIALGGMALPELFDRTAAVIASTLGVDIASVMEAVDGGRALALRAGTGFGRGVVGRRVPATPGTHAAYSLAASGPVAIEDYATEPRFEPSAMLRDHGVASGIAVPIAHASGRWGSLGAHSRAHRRFSAPDIDFMTTVANVLAAAIQRQRAEEQSRLEALHDPLTGLSNRMLFRDRLQRAVRATNRSRARVGVLFLDLDDFKMVNDSLGHEAGDALIADVARRLADAVRSSDDIARFGGDEFAILCEGLHDVDGAVEVAERILALFQRPFDVLGHEHVAQASIGIVLARSPSDSAESLLRDADAAMYRAKDRGRGGYAMLDELSRARVIGRMKLQHELRRAVREHELRLVYQPIYTLSSNELVGAEALLRWQHPARGLLAPGEFLEAAEASDLIVTIGAWALREACRRTAAWCSELGVRRPFMTTVNLAGRQFAHADLVSTVSAVLSESRLAPDRLGLEITERVLTDVDDDPAATLRAFKDIGVKVLLDDFGTGFSSLSRLKGFPIDILKIDRSFMQDLAREGSDDQAIVQAIMGMARALEMDVIAEGIEDDSQLGPLRRFGCDLGQGYHLARPLTVEAFDALVRATAAGSPPVSVAG